MSKSSDETRLAIVGGGPGGYTAAFHAADLGMKVTIIDREANPGGVCLYRGCIPSKALLHAAKLVAESRQAADWGIKFAAPEIRIDRLRDWKDGIVEKLTQGLRQLCRQRKVRYVQGEASFADSSTLNVRTGDGKSETISFEKAILASGSYPAAVPGFPNPGGRIWDSKAALNPASIPKSLLVAGGGYIGLELGTVYSVLGSKVTLVEMTQGLLPGADRSLVSVLARRIKNEFHAVLLQTKIASIEERKNGIRASFEGGDLNGEEREFEAAVVAVGRKPNSAIEGLNKTRVDLDERGFVKVDLQRRTADPDIYAVGDVAGEPMLAHKAMHEGRIAVEAISGRRVAFEPRAIPAVVYTDPEVAWCGLTEMQAESENRPVKVLRYPWGASGRAATMGRSDGLTKLLVDPESEYILGVGIVGTGAGELIAEGVLAIEMAATPQDLALTIHPHPTLSETLMEAALRWAGPAERR